MAVATMQGGYADGSATLDPEPKDKEAYIRAKMYDYRYDSFLPILYDWPEDSGFQPSDQDFKKFRDMT